MHADEPQVDLRPRNAFEAIDLGFAMVRAWWRPIAATWLVIVFPFAAITAVALRDRPWLAVVALWWLRPLFARVPLHVLSRKTFGQPTGVVETLRALPQLARSGILGSLTLRRLSPTRTMLQPVVQLEGLRGQPCRARSSLLASRDVGAAMTLVMIGANLTVAIGMGLFAGLALLMPDNTIWEFRSLFTPFFQDVDMGWLGLSLPGLYFFAISVVEPLLVASGFAMYLNRRVFLEGWDIEIALRRITQRVRLETPSRIAALVLVGILASSLGMPDISRAETSFADVCAPTDPRTSNACADAIIATGDFGGTRAVEWWVPKTFDSPEAEGDAFDGFLDWLGPGLARFAELVLWLAVAAAAIMLASAFARNYTGSRKKGPVERPSPTRLFGLDLAPDSLPEDLVGAARSAWQRGEFIGAMSLLYRGALIHLIETRGIRIPESATEYECVDLVRSSDGTQRVETTRVFKDLTQAWVGTRYAAAPPADATFEALCGAFDHVFVLASDAPNEAEGV